VEREIKVASFRPRIGYPLVIVPPRGEAQGRAAMSVCRRGG
jgi:hypothetical protein